MSPMKRRKKKTKDFPNDWEFFNKMKSSRFNRLTFDEVMEELACNWQPLPSVALVARSHLLPSGRITEHCFPSEKEVRRFMGKISRSGEPYHIYCFDHHQTFTAVFNDD